MQTAARGFVWHAQVGLEELGTLGGSRSDAAGINDHGHVVGSSTNAAGVQRAFLYQTGAMRDLGTLGGPSAVASDINGHGVVIGRAQAVDGTWHGFRYTDATGKQTLPGLLPGRSATAWALNNAGQFVGSDRAANGEWHAYYLDADGPVDLNDRIDRQSASHWLLTGATGINERGDIVAEAITRAEGLVRAVALRVRRAADVTLSPPAR